jgi:hypothetical protein
VRSHLHIRQSCPVGLGGPGRHHAQGGGLAHGKTCLSHTQGSILVVKELLRFDGRPRAPSRSTVIRRRTLPRPLTAETGVGSPRERQ